MRVAWWRRMLAIAHSAVLEGLAAHPVRVEVQAERGVPSFEVVGFAEAAVRESRVRVKSALAELGVDISEYRLVVNLAPADLKKRGSAFDLAIAVAALASLGMLPEDCLGELLFLGELSLNGALHPLRGVVAHLLCARDRGVARAIVPAANQEEAALVEGLETVVASTLAEVVDALRGDGALERARASTTRERPMLIVDDLADVRGQDSARKALEVAAAGGHNLLFIGPPGAGKTMLARRLPGILPPLTEDEALEVLAIHSVAGILAASRRMGVRPFRAPHHTASEVSLVGGGELTRPGEVSLAHSGVLFLDELAEFRRGTLESLRQPLEDGVVTVARAHATVTFPARPLLLGATNPCPCGYRGTKRCVCGTKDARSYLARLSGPVVDRLDLHVPLAPVDVMSLQEREPGEPSVSVRRRVERARAIQYARKRSGETSTALNAHLTAKDAERVCALDDASRALVTYAMEKWGFSARGYGKILRVARTLADLDGATAIAAEHVSVAVGARVLDRTEGSPSPAVVAAAMQTATCG